MIQHWTEAIKVVSFLSPTSALVYVPILLLYKLARLQSHSDLLIQQKINEDFVAEVEGKTETSLFVVVGFGLAFTKCGTTLKVKITTTWLTGI